jgi:hypothetical protein
LILQQNGKVHHATREDHNMFGTNLLGTQGTTCRIANIEFEKQNPSLDCSDPRLERKIGNG